MARKKIERNISYDDIRKRYYVNLKYGAGPETRKQVKKTKTFEKLTQALAALRQHEAARGIHTRIADMSLPLKMAVPCGLTMRQSCSPSLSRTTVCRR